jgi:nucleoid-associated protein YgaU
MNTKVKVGIAAAIVAALVALIVLDQKTAPRDGAAAPPSSPESGGVLIAPPAPSGGDAAVRAIREEQVQDLLRKAREAFSTSSPADASRPADPPARRDGQPPAADPARSAGGDEYVIKPGDTLETIAQERYGSRTFQTLISSANPGLKPNALRVGQKISLPARPQGVEKRVDENVAKDVPADPAPVLLTAGGIRVYVVQSGDTLSQISSKVYKTSRYVDRILEANRDTISDANFLTVGMKLTMPELPVRNASASPAAAATSAPAAAGPTHTVSTGDSLWKIAERYAGPKGVGVLEMIQLFVKANPDKLKDDRTLLRLGWQLVVPE